MKSQLTNLSILAGLLTAILGCPALAGDDVALIAYSMRTAQDRIEDRIPRSASLTRLGGITKPLALVVDLDHDVILVGESDARLPSLTLDDWVVSLRSKMVHGASPGVLTEARDEIELSTVQEVWFLGGIGNTRMGKACLEAAWLLKQMALGLQDPRLKGFNAYYDLALEENRVADSRRELHTRFWFFPLIDRVVQYDNAVALGKHGLAVFPETLSVKLDGHYLARLDDFEDPAGQIFADGFTKSYSELSKLHPALRPLEGSSRLLSLAEGLSGIRRKPSLEFWLREYSVSRVETENELRLLRRRNAVIDLMLFGAVKFIALPTRMPSGVRSELEERVLTTRPGPDALTWEFSIENNQPAPQLSVSASSSLFAGNVTTAWSKALFLLQTHRYDGAIELFNRVITELPAESAPYHRRGMAYLLDGQTDRALADFNRELELEPWLPEAHFFRGKVYLEQGRFNQAAAEYGDALSINPYYEPAYLARAEALEKQDEFAKALADCETALRLSPRSHLAFFQRGKVYSRIGMSDKALADFQRAIELEPRFAEPYLSTGSLYTEQGRFNEALQAFSDFLQTSAFHGRERSGKVEEVQQQIRQLLIELALLSSYSGNHHNVRLKERLRRIRRMLSASKPDQQ